MQTGGRLLARNIIWNVTGIAGPMLLAIVALPVLIRNLGAARFGVLTLIWGMVRYSSYCDFGIGNALTNLIADRISRDDQVGISSLARTGLVLMVVGGILVGSVLAILCPFIVYHLLAIPAALQRDSAIAFYMLAVSMPFLVVTGGLRGILSAYQRFDMINAVRGPADLLSYAALMAASYLTPRVSLIVATLMAVRAIAVVLYAVLSHGVAPPPAPHSKRMQLADGLALLRFGGWMTITNLVNPLLADFDRFVIGALISVEALAYYNTAGELVSKIWQVPLLLEAIWYSAFSHSFANPGAVSSKLDEGRPHPVARLFRRGDAIIMAMLFPISLFVTAFAQEILNHWVGPRFAANTAPILRWLALMILVCGFSEMPALLIQAAHKPERIAKLRPIEIPFVLITVFMMARWAGAQGVAVASVIRVAIDTVVLSLMCHSLVPAAVSIWRRSMWMLFAVLAVFGAGLSSFAAGSKGILLIIIVSIFELVVWRVFVEAEDRTNVAKLFHAFTQRTVAAMWLTRRIIKEPQAR